MLSKTGSENVPFLRSRTFAQNCRNIELLSLNGCTKITDKYEDRCSSDILKQSCRNLKLSWISLLQHV